MTRVRGRIYDEIGPVRRAAEIQKPFSPALSKYLDAVQSASRADLARVFACELDALDTDVRAGRLAMLEIITGHNAWDHLRDVAGMDVDAACLTVAASIAELLESRS
jgi:hypothetical protein